MMIPAPSLGMNAKDGTTGDGATGSKLPVSDVRDTPVAAVTAHAYAKFAGALKDALRDFHRTDLLAQNPLLRSGIGGLSETAGPLELKALLSQTVSTLFGNARDEKLRRHLFFDVGCGQLIAFLEPHGVSGVPASYDADINRGLGVPAAFYHFAFEAGSDSALADKRNELRAKGVEVTEIADHGWAKSIYFKDPNGLSLEYCCVVRDFTQDDATMQGHFTVRRAALDLDNAVGAKVFEAQSRNGE
jgi:catechol 2,3-dioxygenase-like lactoylglutathione lyase family enzyme